MYIYAITRVFCQYFGDIFRVSERLAKTAAVFEKTAVVFEKTAHVLIKSTAFFGAYLYKLAFSGFIRQPSVIRQPVSIYQTSIYAET